MRISAVPFFLGSCLLLTVVPARAQALSRPPVISRMQVLYSVVAHHNSIADRVNFYNTFGDPAGNTNYVVPFLVYEPIVTLYNPYNTVLTLNQSRVRLVNPPVGFRFKKNNDYLRSEWNNGGPFLGLGRFQIANESNLAVQKTITLTLGGGDTTSYAGPIVLQPGESRIFSLRVEQNWTWGLETANGYTARQFHDWDSSANLTNRDRRTSNEFGAEAIAGMDFRAGFQTDSLSVANGSRPLATRYSFEKGNPYGSTSYVAIKPGDSFAVEARGVKTSPGGSFSGPDFQLSLLKGLVTDPTQDLSKSYSFDIEDLMQQQTESSSTPTVSRVLKAGNLLQPAQDPSIGGKTPFASFVLAAKSEALRQRKFQATTQPHANELYEARLDPINSFVELKVEQGPTDHPESGVVVTHSERIGDLLMLDVAAPPMRAYGSWKVKGTTDPAAGFPDDLTEQCVFQEGPIDTGIYKVSVPVPAEGEKYFVRIEY